VSLQFRCGRAVLNFIQSNEFTRRHRYRLCSLTSTSRWYLPFDKSTWFGCHRPLVSASPIDEIALILVLVKREAVSFDTFLSFLSHILLEVHPHPAIPLYTDADGEKGHVRHRKLPFDVVDLRRRK